MKNYVTEYISGIAFRYVGRFVVWDFDGTLHQSHNLGKHIEEQYRILLQRLTGKIFTKREFNDLSTHYGSWSRAVSNTALTPEEQAISFVDKTYNNTKFIQADAVMVSRIQKLNKYKHIILSNATHAQIVSGLQAIGFNKYGNNSISPFVAIAGRDDTGVLKPSIESFRYVLNLTRSQRLRHLFIGDSFETDIVPARAFGFWSLHRDTAIKLFDEAL